MVCGGGIPGNEASGAVHSPGDLDLPGTDDSLPGDRSAVAIESIDHRAVLIDPAPQRIGDDNPIDREHSLAGGADAWCDRRIESDDTRLGLGFFVPRNGAGLELVGAPRPKGLHQAGFAGVRDNRLGEIGVTRVGTGGGGDADADRRPIEVVVPGDKAFPCGIGLADRFILDEGLSGGEGGGIGGVVGLPIPAQHQTRVEGDPHHPNDRQQADGGDDEHCSRAIVGGGAGTNFESVHGGGSREKTRPGGALRETVSERWA